MAFLGLKIGIEIRMRARLKDIAERAGCSVTAVSLVLNNKADSIPDSTKQKVLQAAEELNYRPNQVAVGLKKSRTNTIGLIISDVSNNFFATLTKGVEDESNQEGWNLILCNTNDHHKREKEYIYTLDDKGIDGIILCLAKEDDFGKVQGTVDLLNQLNIPHVMVDRFVTDIEGYFVSVNHEEGGYLAGKYLVEMGHINIGCITGPKNLEDSQDRTRGVCRALEEQGLDIESVQFYPGNYDIESGEMGAEFLATKGVTAIFAYNELMAYGVYRWANKSGVRIPEDISVVGYDDVAFADILHVPLTCVRQPVYEMGRESVRQIIQMIKTKERKKEKVLFQPKLMVRGSVSHIKP